MCSADNGKVRLKLQEKVLTFQLNSSLVPGSYFNCHLELAVDYHDYGESIFKNKKVGFHQGLYLICDISGFFVYFERMDFALTEDCEEDHVQFGRDILFITSYRSKKFCGKIIGDFPTGNKTSKKKLSSSVTPLTKRIYTESYDQEMDIWITMSVPKSIKKPKSLTLNVTPFKKNCDSNTSSYRRCGSSNFCVRKELFCDQTVNCAVPLVRPPGNVSLFLNQCFELQAIIFMIF